VPVPSAAEAARAVDLSDDHDGHAASERAVPSPARPVVLDDDLDIPDFLK
jgi:hypothetical protein